MRIKWKEILFAAVLGFVCPAIIFSLRGNTSVVDSPGNTLAETEPRTGEYINVLYEDGTIHTMELEEYVTCVVLREMPASFELEALKAQAVVARTYALRRVNLVNKHTGAAVCTDPSCCQGFCKIEDYADLNNLQKVQIAVNETAGQVITYNGKLAEATYFSCSGGMTEDASAVWGADIPYLKATESPGEEAASHFTDTVTFTMDSFCSSLGVPFGTYGSLPESVTYTAGGGVEKMWLCGKEFTGTELRRLLGLRSTAFVVTAVGNTVTITTKGYGHRVGMSQYGADAMAVSGSNYIQILSHYYQGTEIQSGYAID